MESSTTTPAIFSVDGIPRLALSPKEAALATGRSKSRIYELLNARVITARKDGASTLIPVSELQRWLANLPEREGAQAA